jgi:hypothetical protein
MITIFIDFWQFSAIFANFLAIFANFRRFLAIFGEYLAKKWRFCRKPNVGITILQKLAAVRAKNSKFSAKNIFLNQNIVPCTA